MKAKHFLTGAALGLVAGLAVSISTAPQAGTQLRSNLKMNTNSFKKQLLAVKDEASHVSQSISTFTNAVKNNIPPIINDVKQSVEHFATDIEPEKNKLKQEIESLQNSLNEIEKNLSDFKKEKKSTN